MSKRSITSRRRPLRFEPLESREMLSLQSALTTALEGNWHHEVAISPDLTSDPNTAAMPMHGLTIAIGGSAEPGLGVHEPFHISILGDGFFIVQGLKGERLFTRNSDFRFNATNELVTPEGLRLLGHGVDDNYESESFTLRLLPVPSLVRQNGNLPGTLERFIVNENGIITGYFDNGMAEPLGQIVLAGYPNARQLQYVSNGLYAAPANSVAPPIGAPGEGGLGTLQIRAGRPARDEPSTPPSGTRPVQWRPALRGRLASVTFVLVDRPPYHHWRYDGELVDSRGLAEPADATPPINRGDANAAKQETAAQVLTAVDTAYDALARSTRPSSRARF